MGSYTESMTLYEESLEAAGTAQSKFNLYLESNQATLDKFRTTLEGLWITIIDSDSLMSIVKLGTSFVELLDSVVQKFGVVGSALNVIIPLVGIKLVWAIRAAYIEMLKLQATGSMTAFMPTTKAIGQIIKQMLGLKTAAGGATIAMGGLTIATAGLTAGIGLLTYGMVKWAQKSREAKEAFANALDNSQNLNDEVKSLDQLIKKQEELSKIEDKTVEQKEELLKVQRELAQLYPELVTGIDNEGNKIAGNLDMTKQLTEEKRKLLEQELLAIKTTADKKLPQLRDELAVMQEEADRIQKRLASGDTKETQVYNGYEIQVDVTNKLKDRLIELVKAQKENHAETAKLESAIKSYNQILEENAERQKWARVEELQAQHARAQTISQYQAIEEELLSMGFTHTDVANIVSGNIDKVKEKYKELDMQQIINLQTVETLDAAQKQAMINMLESSRNATTQLIADTEARITAIKAEIQALAALAGSRVKESPYNRTIGLSDKEEYQNAFGDMTKMLELDVNTNLVDAQRELTNLEDNLKDIEKALENVRNIDTSKMSGTRDPDKKKKKKEYVAEADRYERLNLELDKNNVLLQKNKTLQDLAGKDLAKKVGLMEEEIKLNKQRQDSLHEYNNEQRKEVKELENYLSKQGFKFTGAGDDRMITNLDHIAGKTKEVETAFNRYIQLQKTEIPKASQEWMSLKSNIEKVGQSIEDLTRQSVREMLEAEKRNAYLELDLRKRLMDEELKRLRDQMEDDVEYWQKRIDRTQKEIDDIQEEERYRAEQKERLRRLGEIEKLQDRYYALQYQDLSDLTEEQAKSLNLEKERAQYLEKQAKIQELLLKLENVRREKNIQQLVKNADGTWGFEYVADQREIDKITKDITTLQEEHSQHLKDLKESTLEDLKQKQEDYDEWERQNEIQAEIERKRRRIQNYQDEIKDLQEQFKKKEEKTREAFDIEKENLDRHYMDMDILTDEKLQELYETFDNNWSAIHTNVKSYFDKMEEDYRRLVEVMSKPLPGASSTKSSSSGGSSGSSRREKTSTSEREKYQEDNRRYERENDSEIDRISREHDVDTGVAREMAKTNDREGKKIYHKGGIVGDGSRDLPDIANSLFNEKLKPNEVIVKALRGELFVPEENLFKNFLPNMQNLTSGIMASMPIPQMPKFAMASDVGGDTVYYIDTLTVPTDNFEQFIKDFTNVVDNYPNKAIMKVKKIGQT